MWDRDKAELLGQNMDTMETRVDDMERFGQGRGEVRIMKKPGQDQCRSRTGQVQIWPGRFQGRSVLRYEGKDQCRAPQNRARARHGGQGRIRSAMGGESVKAMADLSVDR